MSVLLVGVTDENIPLIFNDLRALVSLTEGSGRDSPWLEWI